MALRRKRKATQASYKRRVRRKTTRVVPRKSFTVTAQKDFATVYSRRRKRYTKRYGKFARAVQKVNDRNLGTISVVFNRRVALSPLLEEQTYGAFQILGLRGVNTVTEAGMGDIFDLVAGDLNQSSPDTRFHIKSAVLEITGTVLGTSNVPMEIDVYEYIVPRDTQHSSVNTAIADAEGDTATIPGGVYTDLVLSQRGVTPFQLPGLLRNLTITKKTKHFVLPGQSFTHMMKDTKLRSISSKYILDSASRFGDARLGTKGYFVVAKACPLTTIDETTSVTIAAVRTYNYSRESNSTDYNGFRNI